MTKTRDLANLGGGFIQTGTDAVQRTVESKLQDVVSINDFIPAGTDTANTDCASYIQAALSARGASGGGTVYIPPGTYKINSTLSVPNFVSLVGDGANVSVIDASQTPDGSISGSAHIKTLDPTYAALPSLSVNVTKNSRTLTFVSAPSVQPGDIIVIYNPTDYSWSGFRDYYRAGEYLRVASVTGGVVELEGSTCDDYLTTAVTVYKVTNPNSCNWRGFSILAKPNSSIAISGIKFGNVIDGSIEDVRVHLSSYIGLQIYRCFNTQVRGCVATDDFLDALGGEYGLAVSNSHNVNIIGGSFVSRRHGLTIGGGSGIGAVPNRYVSVLGAHISTTGGVQAADIHGNSEYINYSDCTIDGGFAGFGGDFATIDNCQIRGDQVNGPCAVLGSELKGANMKITNNTIQNDKVATSRGALIDIGGNSAVISSETVSGGTIEISDNLLIWGAPSVFNNSPVLIENVGYNGTEKINVVFANNTLSSAAADKATSITVDRNAGSSFGSVSFTNNLLQGAGITVTGNSAANSCDDCFISGNSIDRASTGIHCFYVKRAVAQNNILNNVSIQACYLSGLSSSLASDCRIANNTAINTPGRRGASSSTSAPYIIQHCVDAYFDGNIGGSFNEELVVASTSGFVIGETITGSSSGVTATVLGITPTKLEIGTTASGSFTPSETITGGTSGSSTTVTSQSDAHFAFFSAITTTNLHYGNNISKGPNDTIRDYGITNEISSFGAPDYSTADRDALAAPYKGQIIVNTSTNKLNFYNGTAWEAVTST